MDRKFLVGLAKDWGIALLVAVAVFSVWSWFQPKPPGDGPAPDFTFEALDGTSYTLSELEGKQVVLNFWATWCGPCREEIPELAQFHLDNPDVVLLGISVDEQLTTGAVSAKAEGLGINYPVLHDADDEISGPYGVSTLPTTFVIDTDGTIIATRIGGLNQSVLEAMLD